MNRLVSVAFLFTLSAIVGCSTMSMPGDPIALESEPPTSYRFDNADSIKEWAFSNGAEWPGATGKLYWSLEGKDAPGSAAIDFDFTKGGAYCAAMISIPPDVNPTAVRMLTMKPGSNKMIFRATDSTGQVFQKDFNYTYPGWQEIEITFDGWHHSWGGDGEPHPPFKQFDILIQNEGNSQKGTLYFDNLMWIEEAGTSPFIASVQNVITEFDKGWSPDAHTPSKYKDGKWTYVFDKKDRSGLNCGSISIMGRPQKMFLTVESDGSGNELSVVTGSHFQMFEKVFGKLTEKGTMTFEVPVGDCSTWRHFAGEDDGIVRYPLRVLQVVVHHTEGAPETGTIKPISLEAFSEYDKGTAIQIVPSAKRDGKSALFTAEVRSLLEKPVTAKLEWSIWNADKCLDEGIQSIRIPAKGKPATFSKAYEFDFNQVLEGRFRVLAPDQYPGEVSITLAQLPKSPGVPTLDPENPMGVGLYLYRFNGHPQYKKKLEQMCDLGQRAGIKWTREEFQWHRIETAKGQYDWTYYDDLVDTATKHGISIYGLVCYWSEWTKPNTEEGFEDYCDYIQQLVRRYGDRIKHWEIWNEPNIFFWSGTREQYTELLKRAYKAVKEVDPEAQVLGCSTAGIHFDFIQFVVDNGGTMDALTVHPYRGQLNSAVFIDELKRARKIVGDKPVWITEMGWPSMIGGVTERAQAGYVARTYIASFASNAVKSVSWYDFREDGNDPFYNEHHFGLVRHDNMDPKMGYAALAAVGNLLPKLPCTKISTPVEGVEQYDFADKDRQVSAIWSTETERWVCVNVSDPAVAFWNIAGDPLDVRKYEGNYAFKLYAGQPVYIKGKPGMAVKFIDFPVRVKTSHDKMENAVRTSETIQMTIDAPKLDIKAIHWKVPTGWKSPKIDNDGKTASIHVPEMSGFGLKTVTAIITSQDDQTWDIPVTISVVPNRIRG